MFKLRKNIKRNKRQNSRQKKQDIYSNVRVCPKNVEISIG